MKPIWITTLLLIGAFSLTNSFANPIATQPDQQAWSFSEALKIDPMNISGIVITDQFMALATDEGNQIELFKRSATQSWQSLYTLSLTDRLEEIDVEALAWKKPYLYALGSHSAKRKKLKNTRSQKDNIKRLQQIYSEPARQQLFRIELDTKTQLIEVLSLSLTDVLTEDPILEAFVGLPSKENGIDMEGLAIDHKGRLLIGLRGPVLRGNLASVLRIQLDKKAFKVKKTKTLYLNAQGRGVRGLSETDQGLIVLTGAVGDQQMAYQIYLWDGKNALPGKDHKSNGFTLLCELPDTGGKPEGVQFIKTNPQKIEFVIVNDGLTNGNPTQYHCPSQ